MNAQGCWGLIIALLLVGLTVLVFAKCSAGIPQPKVEVPLEGIIPIRKADTEPYTTLASAETEVNGGQSYTAWGEAFTSTAGDQLLTTNSSGNFVSVNPVTNTFYCDGSGSCTQPYAASQMMVGTSSSSWTAGTDGSGNLTFGRTGNSSGALVINASGYVFGKTVAVRVYRTGGFDISSSSVTATTSGTVTYEYNPKGTSFYSSSTGLFTMPYSGLYRINFYIRFSDTSGDRGVKPSVYGTRNIIPNSDGMYWCGSDASGRRCLTWSDLYYFSSGESLNFELNTACTVVDWICTIELASAFST